MAVARSQVRDDNGLDQSGAVAMVRSGWMMDRSEGRETLYLLVTVVSLGRGDRLEFILPTVCPALSYVLHVKGHLI